MGAYGTIEARKRHGLMMKLVIPLAVLVLLALACDRGIAPSPPTSRPTLAPVPIPVLTPTSTPPPTVRPTPTPIHSPQCLIKGNISFRTGEKIYHVPGGEFYDETVINASKGERWFCTEAEARAAGWRKSQR